MNSCSPVLTIQTLAGAALLVTLAAAVAQADEPSSTSEVELSAIYSVFSGQRGEWIDLTHAFSEDTIYWPTDTRGFELEELAHGHTEAGWFYSSYRFSTAEHGGTHLDAPIHFAQGRHASDEVPLSNLIGPAAVVDVSAQAHPDYLISIDDFRGWEAEHGRLPDGAIVLVRTGWDMRYGDRAAYLGTDETGPEAVPKLHFPGLDPEAARWLADERDIAAFGLDTPSVDYGQSKNFRAHVVLYRENIPGFENIANLSELPPSGSFVVALPMKIKGGSGGPLRIVGYKP